MLAQNSEQHKVAEKIRSMFVNRFDALVNVDKEEHYIGTMFPDMILVDKKTKSPLFIIEIRNNGQIAACMNAWKAAPAISATLYIIVPKEEFEKSKSMATVIGVRSRFGYYIIDKNTGAIEVVFE
ncbi:MAG: hypothetical protein U0T84_10455 [Chitinophagales bacterium]